MQDTEPPRIPLPGDAPCAVDSISEPTEASTDALHAAAADVPDGTANETLAVNTTVEGGIDDTEGVTEDERELEAVVDALSVLESDVDAMRLLESDVDAVRLLEREGDTLALLVSDADTLAEGEVE